jgi:L-alanine-DL-glutamate epimerase-like enolase superfamily enzyme
VRAELVGCDARAWRKLAAQLAARIPEAPSARAALEMAMLDALCRHRRLSLWTFFGGAESDLVSDITIVTGSVTHGVCAAERALRDGFSTLKIKIGGGSLSEDAERVLAIAAAAPTAKLVLDANASLTSDAALELLSKLGGVRERIALFEQPTAKEDLLGLRSVRERGGVKVAADESACSAADVARLGSERAVDVVNLKIMKCGVAETLDMAATARAHGISLMIGGMVETRLAMSVSACLAAGLGGFAFVDLDTPLFIAEDPFVGGFEQQNARITVSGIELGHGVERRV